MTDFPALRRLRHTSLRAVSDPEGRLGGASLRQAGLNDQQRLAVVFQGAALLAHLEHGGFYLGTGLAASAWDDAEVDSEGRLLVGEIRPGRAADLPQTFLKSLLLKVFRSEDKIAGRGPARLAARRLLEIWRPRLTPLSPDVAVAEILDAASYLWAPGFAAARRALAGEHHRNNPGQENRSYLWLVGPGRSRRRFLRQLNGAEPGGRAALEALAGSDEAQELWEGFDDDPGTDPWQLYHEGRFEHAAAVWRRRKRRTKEETLSLARALRAAGKTSQALDLVKRRKDANGLLLKAVCQMELEERQSADRTIRILLQEPLSDDQLVEAAEIQIRLAAGRYQHESVRRWIARLLTLNEEPARTAALIVAAGAAFDLGDRQAMGHYLDEAAAGAQSGPPELTRRWHQNEGLRRWYAGDGPGAVEHLTRALAIERRKVPRATAARLWNDLAVARASAGDLSGAEHACRHSLRLFSRCDGKGRHTLGLSNLAELRVRRGLLRGVADILERSTAENRLANNRRGLAHDLAFWARYELAQGRATAALARCAEARQSGDVCNQDVLDVLAARAHGWLEQPERAAECLDRQEPDAVEVLDHEERSAVWALAGRFDEAYRLSAGTQWQELWGALAVGEHPGSAVWPGLDTLDPYRAARLIFDLELVKPGVVPPNRLRRALELFRSRKLTGFAEVLEQRAVCAWQATATYCRHELELDRIADLFRDAGYPDAKLSLRSGDRSIELISSTDGATDALSHRRQAQLGEDTLILEATSAQSDPILDALFRLVSRDLSGGSAGSNLEALLSTALDEETSMTELESRASNRPTDPILGHSPALRKALGKIDRLAKGDLPVLILGESGTGKELAARRVHHMSNRYTGTFAPLNCASLSESLIQSTLFGHVKGAFTGADQNRQGFFETARGGTVFLDEIGDLPFATQGNLLRVLQEGEIRRVGDSLPRKVDVRVVAATHRDLAAMVQEGTFRQDLYFRLKVAKVELPALRDRGADLLQLADHFALKERGARIDPKARKILRAYRWPGNIRELVSVIRVAATYADFDLILPEHLEDAGLPVDLKDSKPQETPAVRANGNFHQLVEDYRKQLVSEALESNDKNQSAAARQLGLTRQALSYLARKMGLI